MNVQKVYLNSCQILIDSLVFSKAIAEPCFYFVWKKGKKFSKSHFYDVQQENESASVREKLQLSLKLYQTNGKTEIKNTHLFLMVSQEQGHNQRQVGHFVLGVHQWDVSSRKMQLQIKQQGNVIGIIRLHARKKQVMQLQNFQKYNSEIEQSSEGQESMLTQSSKNKINNMDLIHYQKQIQDLKYLNEKLKKDRTFLIGRNEVVQKQIGKIKSIISIQLQKVKQYYQKKITMHASIYQQQIQQLITAFNDNSAVNISIIKSTILQNQSLAASLAELKIETQQELEKQEKHYKIRIADLEEERDKLDESLHQLYTRIEQSQKQLAQTQKKLQNVTQELDNTTLNYSIDKKQFKNRSQNYEKTLETLRKQISDFKNQIAQKDEQFTKLNQKHKTLTKSFDESNQKLDREIHQKIKVQSQLQVTKQMLESLKAQKISNLQVIKQYQTDYQTYLSDAEKKNISYQKQLQELQLAGKQRQMQFDKMINQERQKYFSQNLKLTEITMKFEDAQKAIIVREQQIKTYIDENAKLNEQFLQQHTKVLQMLQKVAEVESQQQHYRLLYQTTQTKVQLLTDQLDSAFKKSQEDLQAMRASFDETIKNRERYYQQEILSLQNKLENSQNTYSRLSLDFRNEMEEYKKQLEKLQQQTIKLTTQNNELTATVGKLQFQNGQFQLMLSDAKQMMKQREKKYEENLKMFLVSTADDAKINIYKTNSLQNRGLMGTSSLQMDFQNNEDENFLSTNQQNKNRLSQRNSQQQYLQLQVPKFDRNIGQAPQLSNKQHQQYLKLVEQLGSLQHINYLKSIEQVNKQNVKIIQRLQKAGIEQNEKQKQMNEVIEQNAKQIEVLKTEIVQLQQIIEELKTQINEHIETDEKINKDGMLSPKIHEDIQRSFMQDAEHSRIISQKQRILQDNRLKRQINKSSLRQSTHSRKSFKKQYKDSQVQVNTITAEDVKNVQKYLTQIVRSQQQLLASQQIPTFNIPKIIPKNISLKNSSGGLSANSKQEQKNIKSLPPTPKITKYSSLQSQKMGQKSKKSGSQLQLQISKGGSRAQQSQLQAQIATISVKLVQAQQLNQQYKSQLYLKQTKVQKLQARNRQIFDELCNAKQQLGLKISENQSKILLEYSTLMKKDEGQLSKMKNTILQKQNQKRQLEHSHQLHKNKVNYQIQQLNNQVKKLKRQLQEAQSKNKRYAGNDFMRLIQQDLDEANKKIIQSNRSLNQVRLDKQSVEDQVKMVRKKINDLQKSLRDQNDKKSLAEQELQNNIRKFNKARRDLQERDEQLFKVKQQYKKMQEQINNYSNISSQNLMQRKKFLQQKLDMQDQINKKEAQNRRLQKQLNKQIQKIEDKNQNSKYTRNQTSKEVDRLEGQLIKNKKMIRQYEEQIQILTRKVQVTQQRSKANIQQIKSNYCDKLNLYVNQINEIKNVLAANQQQIIYQNAQKLKLKMQLDKSDAIIAEYQQLQQKLVNDKTSLNTQLSNMALQLNQTKKELAHYQEDCIQMHNKLAVLQQQLNKQRMISVNKTQRVQQYENLSEKYLYELKNVKVTAADLEEKQNKLGQMGQKIRQLTEQNNQITQMLIKTQREYQKYKSQFTFSKSQLQQLVNEIKDSYEQARKKQLADTIDELDQQFEAKNIKRQKQIIQLYSQNARMKVNIQTKQDENAQIMQRYVQIQSFPKKYRNLKDQYDGIVQQLRILKISEVQWRNNEQRLLAQIKQLQRLNNDLKNELNITLTTLTNEKVRLARVQQQLIQSQTGYNMLRDEIKKLGYQHNDKSQYLKTTIQNYEQKILSIELQNTRIKQREQNMHREYKDQLGKMQAKIKQVISAMQLQNLTLQRQSKSKLADKDRLLKQVNKQILIVQQNLRNTQQQIDALKIQNDELSTELSNTRFQMSEDQDIYITEINKLKNNIKDMEDAYNQNLNDLEQQLAEINRQLTMERLKNRDNGGLSGSRLRQSDAQRRLDQRMRAKDAKIQQLKNNIFILQQTVVNLKKKSQFDDLIDRNSNSTKYKQLYTQLFKQHQIRQKKYQKQRERLQDTIKLLRKQIINHKQNTAELAFKYDQQILEIQSLKCELATLKQIYQNLQKQVDKRQLKMPQNINLQSVYKKQIQYKNNKINQLQSIIIQLKQTTNNLNEKIKVKQSQITIINERLQIQVKNISKIRNKDMDAKKMSEWQQSQNKNMKQQIQSLTKQNKRLCNEIDILKNQLIIVNEKESQLNKVNRQLFIQKEQLMSKVLESQDIVGKYTILNEKAQQNYNVKLEQLVLGGYIDQKFFDQEQQLNQLRQDYQEMKFSEDRRQLDLQQIKRQNLQLNIKAEQHEFVCQQVQNLRRICDKLQEEKKIAIFREQAIRVRLSNLLNRKQQREGFINGLEAILNYNHDLYT